MLLQPKQILREQTPIGTWNTWILHQCRKQLAHDQEWHRWEIVELEEVRWPGFWETATDHKLVYSGEDTRNKQAGRGLPHTWSCPCSIPISSRLVSMYLCQSLTMSPLSEYMLWHPCMETTTWKSFYKELDKEVLRKDILVFDGWNAKAGPDACQQ